MRHRSALRPLGTSLALLLLAIACRDEQPLAPSTPRLALAGNTCSGVTPTQAAPGYDPYSETALVLWRNYINVNLVNGYLPAGTYYIRSYRDEGAYGHFPLLSFWDTYANKTICGDGDATIIDVDLNASGDPNQQVGFKFYGGNVTLKDMKLVGNAYATPVGGGAAGGTGVMFDNVAGGRATNLTINQWGLQGIFLFNSTGVTVDGNRIDAQFGTLSMGINVFESRSTSAPYSSRHTIRNNSIKNTTFECIILEGGSDNMVIGNTLDTCVDGIAVQGWSGFTDPITGSSNRVAARNVLRNNRISNAGGPQYSSDPSYPNTRWGAGIHVYFQASGTTIVGNVITNMRTVADRNGQSAYRHGILVGDNNGSAGNEHTDVFANTITWATRPADYETSGIWVNAQYARVDFNVLKNGANGVWNGRYPSEIRENYFNVNYVPVRQATGWPAPSLTCNRYVSNAHGNANATEGSCNLAGTAFTTQGTSYFTGADCTGTEYVSTASPNTFNSTGRRGSTRMSPSFLATRASSGICSAYSGAVSSYSVYR